MDVLIKNATILSPSSPHHGEVKDILVEKGKIKEVGSNIRSLEHVKVIEGKTLYCCTGLVDIGTYTGEPGYEHRETLATLAAAATAGGYTALVTSPNTKPYIQTKADLLFLIQGGKNNHLNIYPLGALSVQGEGVDIAEYYDMHHAGAVGFSDGLVSCQNSGLLARALMYVKAFNGIIVHHPEDKTLAAKGLMHEGFVSTTLGMKGIPVAAELAMVQRDLLMLDYTESRLMIHGISSGEAVALVKKARKDHKQLYVSVPYMNLVSSDKQVEGFDAGFKVKPVIRGESDRKTLVKAVSENNIDVIISNHVPVDEDGKKVEFPYADFGASGLETAFIATIDALSAHMKPEDIVLKFTDNPRHIFGLPKPEIAVGASADLCIFERGTSYVFNRSLSLSQNNPYLGKTFQTRIRCTVNGSHTYIAAHE